jgi:DNA mismatch repair protein MutS
VTEPPEPPEPPPPAGTADPAVTAAREAPSPMLAQYFHIKQSHPDCLLFFRMGDFYELFFEDAIAAAAALDITLTKRGQFQGRDIPMCGVPWHSHEAYLARLIRRGFKVALCEQLEDPQQARARAKEKGGRKLVERAVVRIVTPGTVTEDSLLEPGLNNYLVALGQAEGAFALAWVDISTGEMALESPLAEAIAAALDRLGPAEIVVPERLAGEADLAPALAAWKARLSIQPDASFSSETGRRRLLELHGVATLDGFGAFTRAELAAAGGLLAYIALTQQGRLPRLAPPKRLGPSAGLEIDPATRRNLELLRTLGNERTGSLLWAIDRTQTNAGSRLLARRLAQPFAALAPIEAELDSVGFFAAQTNLAERVRTALKSLPDLERALSRLSLERGGPRDLAAVKEALVFAEALRAALDAFGAGLPPPLARLSAELDPPPALIERLSAALAAELPLLARDGGFIRPGFSGELDRLRSLRDESRRLIAGLQQRYAEDYGVANLKIKHNNVLGFFVETTPAQAERLQSGEARALFMHRQTLAGAVRFGTVELSTLEREIGEAAEKALAIELSLFSDLSKTVLAEAAALGRIAEACAAIDVASALAVLAREERWTRPLVDESQAFAIEAGRHPVVEKMLAETGSGAFMPNDCALPPERRLWLLTGPNMAGKSTFLRQNALVAVLAQIGSYVPAKRAHIGIIDRLFSRVGASDDLARGRSTFMVEMIETAAILNRAGPRSLVILDEIGRGTATFDGLSIAWATIEHLHDINRCRALFATHYHELTALTARLPALACHTMRVKEWEGAIVFLHEVAPGAADRSYGIHVAKLAGLPPAVIARAEAVLASLEQEETAGALGKLADDLPLFRAAPREATEPVRATPSPVLARLQEIEPDTLSPRAALERLYELKALARDS